MGHPIGRRTALIGLGAAATAAALSPVSADAPVTHEIRIKRFAYLPDRLEVRPGDKIRWTNEDLAPHTATATELGWDTGELARDQSAEVVVTAEMETAYFCVFHPHMTARLVIV